jgi:HEAT repeat protein
MTKRGRMARGVGCSVTILVLIVLICGGASQDASTGRFATFKQLLVERNIALTEGSLVAALRNTDAHVRYLAALVLAEDKATDAASAIADALASEKVPETRVNIALALAQLGDENGFVALQKDCVDTALATSLRMYAAKYLLDLHNEGCLSAIEDVLRSTKDVGSRVLAMSQLARFQHASEGDADKILDSLTTALSDPDPTVRIAASHALGALGNLSAVPHLQNAIAVEHDEAVRPIMQADLRRLQGKGAH